jgi:pimeloyl-ACP methyl ester carboxylesterase
VELTLERDAFAEVYAGDLPAAAATDAARTQRPVAAAALEERARDVAWRSVPSWYLVTLEDRMVRPDAQRFMAHRAGARTTEVEAAHSVLRSHPEQVAACIRSAACAWPLP